MKSKAHQRYVLKDGTIVPGVTTPLNLLSKPALIPWANRLGLQGIDVSKYVDDKAAQGTLAHAFATDHLLGIPTDTSDYDSHQISGAANAALSFFNWLDSHPIKPILIEKQLVSEAIRYGGTIDIYGELDGKLELIDLKTGSGIWPEMNYQVSAYRQLLVENGHPVDNVRILNIPRTEDEGFLEKVYTERELDLGWRVFLNCLSIYTLKKQLKHR